MKKNLIFPAGNFMVEGTGHFFDHTPQGKYADPNIDIIRRYISKSGVFYDIGANIGLVSLGLCDVVEHIVAVEPSSSTFSNLVKNTTGLNVTPVQALIGAAGEDRLFLDNTADSTGSASIKPGQRPPSGHDYLDVVELKTMSLDCLVKRHGAPAFIKIDVEGSEISVLESGKEILKNYKPHCLVEFNALTLMNFGGINPPEALAIIRQVFPCVYRVGAGGLEPIQDDYAFMVQHVLLRGCVDDLFCSFASPLDFNYS